MAASGAWCRARAAAVLCALTVLCALYASMQVAELQEFEELQGSGAWLPPGSDQPPAHTSTPPPAPPPASAPSDRGPDCSMHSCFDYSRCPLTGGFSVYFYDPHEVEQLLIIKVDEFLKTSFSQVFQSNPHITTDPNTACVFVVLVGESNSIEETDAFVDESSELKLNVTALQKLRYWGAEGRNHVVVWATRSELGRALVGHAGRALLAQARFARRPRAGFDLVLPLALGPVAGDVWQDCEPLAPATRRYLLSFQGSQTPGKEAEGEVAGALRALEGAGGRNVELQWSCEPAEGRRPPPGDWALCGSARSRRALLAASSFALLPPGALLPARLLEALRAGAVPVLLAAEPPHLPFAEVVDWSLAVLEVPLARAAEVPLLLRALPDADVLLLRRQGRVLWERYLSTVQAATDSLLSLLRTRLLLPPPPAPAAPAPPAFGSSLTPPQPTLVQPTLVQPSPEKTTPEEILGPLEPPFPSPAYIRNFSLALVHKYAMWNEWLDPFAMFPQLPWDPPVTSGARFLGPRAPYRPLEAVEGAPGTRMRLALGGDYPREQFTIVILNYERPASLTATLTELRNLPYLNKVVVVWNGESDPASMAPWPASGAPVVVVRGANNSLNNRFLPYDVLDTAAVLCLDDDSHLQRDQIVFAFRVWRQHRDQIVGLPGRTHAWSDASSAFIYHSYYSCEVSMVLTGAAFLHRYYLFAYWRLLPRAVRDYVDRHRNCEDIAMNFLVAHLTRKPPIKVTGRTQFGEPGPSLSSKVSHYEQRNKCIQFFSKVLGYTPLMLTQYRADSILYNTNMSDRNMCFKHV